MQTAYRILVAARPENLAAGIGDLWDSGKIESDRSIQIDYQGAALKSFQRCYWNVRVWDLAGRASASSQPALWEMGILDESAWQAKWITAAHLLAANEPLRAPLFRKSFRLRERPKSARAYICGLGYYELYLNGSKVGDHVLDPAQTNYEHYAFYVTYDITGLLSAGENAAGVCLGAGWFHQDVVWQHGKYSVPGGTDYGVPRVLLQIRFEYHDGTVETVCTDETWKAAPGPTLSNNIYAGELYDARQEIPGWADPGFDDAAWSQARRIESPSRRLRSQAMPPIRRIATRKPVGVSQPKPGVFVYDLGQNFAGWARLRVTVPRGTRITLRFAESLAGDGMIDPASTGVFATHVVQTDTYIAKGAGQEAWEPRFTYHGFRYVEMTGFPGTPALENLEGVVVHSDVPTAGRFECSDAMLNRIHDTALWTEVSNLYGVPTDCPARERCGWLGDAQVTAEMTIYNFNMAQFWAKFADDIATSARNGLPTMVAPGKRETEEATPDWGTAAVQIPWYVYLYYGDQRILRQHYDGMRRWLEHLRGIAKDYIVSEGLGDWCPPRSVAPKETPVALTSTAYFFLDSRIVSDVARILGKEEDARGYRALAGQIHRAFNRKFFDPRGLTYGSQTADSFALRLGLAPPADDGKVASSLARDVTEKHGGHFSTGITGSRWLYWALGEYGHGDVALRILRQKTYPSIGYLYSLGATTFWETWGEPELDRQYGTRSLNHPMQGGFDAWFYQGLAGICADPDHPGFKHAILRPQVVEGLDRVRAEYDSIHGRIVSEWRREGDRFHWRVVLPANTSARVYLPCDSVRGVTESGRPLGQAPGVSQTSERPGFAILEIGSGEYAFAARLGSR
jgi:alpha-L-rhamnosidase